MPSGHRVVRSDQTTPFNQHTSIPSTSYTVTTNRPSPPERDYRDLARRALKNEGEDIADYPEVTDAQWKSAYELHVRRQGESFVDALNEVINPSSESDV